MSERLNKCPLCKSGHFLNHQEIPDFAVSKESFVICRCTNCNLLFTNPRPGQEEIGPYYEFPEYFSHDDESKSLTQSIYNLVRKRNIKNKIHLIESYVRKGTWLDYGCGTGELLYAAKENNWKVAGIEPNEKARGLANKKLGEKVKESLDEIKKSKSFDVITLFHVLEHIHELRKTVKKLLNRLNSNGYIIIAVPNPESEDAKHYGKYWAGWDVPRHLYHFDKTSINSFKEIFGLNLVDVKPMKFDSYYVSLLSEGYKNKDISTFSKFIKAFTNGYNSNSKGKKNNNYSSNIFIFQKQ
ncbi:methyltransferase family protein [Algoriphagus boseongensis]|uniref:Methyltransferase family protein n=1 Tax=Algoriphagus boseongensis TaxID=1442587 RepID=A0A4R6T5Y9_9BACT|nr:methyltransferase domain-containing protein [Algoriphagus boseongensis]TDQ17072.1 methyltransferase family protein [Algoriphagus boseongensis]